MKKLQILAVLILSLLFVVSCVSDEDDDDFADTYSGGDTDTSADTLPSDPTDTTDPTDSTNPTNPTDPTNPTSDPTTEPTNPTDPTDPTTEPTTEPTTDPTNPTDPTTEPTPEQTEEEKCTAAGGTWNENETESTCTKITNCAEMPENSEPNGETSYTQTYTDGAWSDEIPVEYNSEEAGICRFKCAGGHFWHDSACITDPCNAETDPCDKENTTPGSCSPIDSTNFTCGCKEAFHWEDECTSNSRKDVSCINKPDHADWNTEGGVTPVIDQTWNDETQHWEPSEEGQNGTQTEGCYFSCNENYGWAVANEIGKCLPECVSVKNAETPCKDSANGRIWSARSALFKTWSEAKEYCANLEEGGYPQGTWQLPTINDLRTIIVKCTYNMPDGNCGVTDDCTASSCYNNLNCNNTNHSECKSDNNSNDGCGSHSKLCETSPLWSSSTKDNNNNAWFVKFSEGNIGYTSTDNNTTRPVRCVIRYNLNENDGEDSDNPDD